MTAVAEGRSRTRWTQVDRGVYVANRRGDFVGYVAPAPVGGYVAFDSASAPLGRHETLDEAQAALVMTARPRGAMRQARVPARFALQAALVAAGAGAAVLVGEVLVTLT